jgi:hypothetical protein
MKHNSVRFRNIFFISAILVSVSCERTSLEDGDMLNYRSETKSIPSKKLDHFFFIGSYGGQFSIYKFELNDNSYQIFWYSPKETVVKYLYSRDFKYAFFLTARKIGTDRGLSFISGIKLYRLDPEQLIVEELSNIGDAIQIFIQWTGMNLNIQFTRFNLKIASYIDKINQLYSPFGKLLKEDNEAFDFINDHYPQFDIGKVSLTSPSGNFEVIQSADSIFLKIAYDEQKIFIDSTSESVSKVKWSSSEDYIIFTVINKKDVKGKIGSSRLLVYNLRDQILEIDVESTEQIDFIITDDLVIYERESNFESYLTVYNFEKDKEMYRINVKGGCALSTMPGV